MFGPSFVFFGILDLLCVLGLLGVFGLSVQRLKPPNHNSDPYSGPVFFCVCSIFSPVYKRLLGLFSLLLGLSFVFFDILGVLGLLGLLVQRL